MATIHLKRGSSYNGGTQRAKTDVERQSIQNKMPKILCVDDDPDVSHSIQLRLSKDGVDMNKQSFRRRVR